MSLEIKTKPVDLYSLIVNGKAREQQATNELVTQILGWLNENDKNLKTINTLIMNKLVYFSLLELRKTNPRLMISNGWYKYGPCYEELRQYEAPDRILDYAHFKPRAFSTEVENVCKTHFALYEKSRHEKYFFNYLKFIYSRLVPDNFVPIQPFYLAKLELSNLTYEAFTAKETTKFADKFSRAIYDFESSVCNADYSKFCDINQADEDIMLTFTSMIEPLYTRHIFSSDAQKSNKARSFASHLAIFFDERVLLPLSYRNLFATFQSPVEAYTKVKKRKFETTAKTEFKQVRKDILANLKLLKTQGLT